MTLKAKFLLLWNTIVLLPAIIASLFWFAVSVYAIFESLVVVIFTVCIFLVVSSIVDMVRLKLRMLKDIGDPDARAVRKIYKGASKINWAAYAILYPITLGMWFGKLTIVGLFLFIALFVAIPLRVKASNRAKEYDKRKRAWGLGRWSCPRCGVSLGFHRRKQRWMCLGCGRVFKPSHPMRKPSIHRLK